jgi:hypothetical protein
MMVEAEAVKSTSTNSDKTARRDSEKSLLTGF